MTTKREKAPELQVERWLNTPAPIVLDDLRGQVVVIEAFQMLCPGCVAHGLPQAIRVARTFSDTDVVVLGLHTVFEHHSAQGTYDALAAFIHEYQIPFPVGIDRPSPDQRVPATMASYQLEGTPTMILIDQDGNVRAQHLGQIDDMALGAQIMALINEAAAPATAS